MDSEGFRQFEQERTELDLGNDRDITGEVFSGEDGKIDMSELGKKTGGLVENRMNGDQERDLQINKMEMPPEVETVSNSMVEDEARWSDGEIDQGDVAEMKKIEENFGNDPAGLGKRVNEISKLVRKGRKL